MYLITILIAALLGLLTGFIGGKLYGEKTRQQTKLKQQVADSQSRMEHYKNEVSSHLAITQNLMDEMKSNYDNIAAQLSKTTRLLETPQADKDDRISYFATDTATQLLNANADRPDEKRTSIPVTTQPSDYSSQPSGLLSEEKPHSESLTT